jgi:hypothetical protein
MPEANTGTLKDNLEIPESRTGLFLCVVADDVRLRVTAAER